MADRLSGGLLRRDPGAPANREALRAGSCRTWTVAAASLTLALAATLVWMPRPVLVWNGSPSSPRGLYALVPGRAPVVGDMAVAWPPDEARRLAAERRYLPSNVPLVKHVAAVAGDHICATGDLVMINGQPAAARRSRDPSGRLLPSWSACRRLQAGELLLLASASDAFDGRYFGVTGPGQVVGKAQLLWAP